MTDKPLSKAAQEKKLKAAIKRADRWFDKYIVLRDKKCIRCGGENDGQCSHYYGKQACPELRYEVDNAHRMCKGCHFKHHKFDDRWYDNWMRHNFTAKRLDKLEELSINRPEYGIEYFEHIETKYKAIVKSMGG